MCDVWMCVPLRMYAENYCVCVCVCVCELCVYAWHQDGLGLYILLVYGVPSGCRVSAYICVGIDVDLIWFVCAYVWCMCTWGFG